MLDIPRKATLAQVGKTVVSPCFVGCLGQARKHCSSRCCCGLRIYASDVRPTAPLAAGVESPSQTLAPGVVFCTASTVGLKYINIYIYHVCIVTHIAKVWISRVRLPILLVVISTEKMNISLSAFVPENLVSRDGFGSSVPRQSAHLQTQAESGAYLRDSSRVPRRRPFIHYNRHTRSGQSRVYRVTQLRTNGVHCQESAGTGPVNLKVVPN